MKKIILLLILCIGTFTFFGFTVIKKPSINVTTKRNGPGDVITTGKVVEAFWGNPISGAFVTIKGTSFGTVTDWNGNYTLINTGSETLVVSYLGYITQEIKINDRTEINVYLELDHTHD